MSVGLIEARACLARGVLPGLGAYALRVRTCCCRTALIVGSAQESIWSSTVEKRNAVRQSRENEGWACNVDVLHHHWVQGGDDCRTPACMRTYIYTYTRSIYQVCMSVIGEVRRATTGPFPQSGGMNHRCSSSYTSESIYGRLRNKPLGAKK